MIVYLDASALVKRYVAETGSAEVASLISEAQAIGTAVVSRAEVAAALAQAALCPGRPQYREHLQVKNDRQSKKRIAAQGL